MSDYVTFKDRAPDASFEIASLNVLIYFPSIKFWSQLFSVLLLDSCFKIVISAIIFKFVLPNRTSIASKLIVFGAIYPTVLGLPYFVIDLLDIDNLFIKLSAGIMCFLTVLRLSEMLFDYAPNGCEKSMPGYALYFSTPITPEMNKEKGIFISCSRMDMQQGLSTVGWTFLYTSVLLSCLAPSSYRMFSNKHSAQEDWKCLLADNFCIACLFQTALDFFSANLGCTIQLVTGYKTVVTMKNPIFSSKSPSEFWGKRWNLVIHGLLKRGVFKPSMFCTSSKVFAMVNTFFVSGVLHEWMIHIMVTNESYIPKYGYSTMFFLWNALFIAIEIFAKDTKVISLASSFIPQPLATTLIVCCVLPIAHWFADDYINSGYFDHMTYAFPIIYIKS